MSSIAPTVGRKVWFYTMATDHFRVADPKQPFDATVVFVHTPTLVNLLVVNHSGQTMVREGVELRDPSPDDKHGADTEFATWMPYQVGQAKKDAS